MRCTTLGCADVRHGGGNTTGRSARLCKLARPRGYPCAGQCRPSTLEFAVELRSLERQYRDLLEVVAQANNTIAAREQTLKDVLRYLAATIAGFGGAVCLGPADLMAIKDKQLVCEIDPVSDSVTWRLIDKPVEDQLGCQP